MWPHRLAAASPWGDSAAVTPHGQIYRQPASGCMIPSHLAPDSGVIDSDLCQRRRECQRENMCVSSHQPPFCLRGGHSGRNNKKIPKYDAANPPRAAVPSGPAVSNTNIYSMLVLPLKYNLEYNPHSFSVLVAPQHVQKRNKKIKINNCAGLDGSHRQKLPRSAINHSQMSPPTISPPPT